jgi:hypothetical protein
LPLPPQMQDLEVIYVENLFSEVRIV